MTTEVQADHYSIYLLSIKTIEGLVNKKKDDYIFEHCVFHHNLAGKSSFIMKVIQFQDALSR